MEIRNLIKYLWPLIVLYFRTRRQADTPVENAVQEHLYDEPYEGGYMVPNTGRRNLEQRASGYYYEVQTDSTMPVSSGRSLYLNAMQQQSSKAVKRNTVP